MAPSLPTVVPTPYAALPERLVLRPAPKVTIDSVLGTLTLREKVGQLVMPWLLGNYAPFAGEEFDRLNLWVDTLGVGGIIISIGSPLDVASKLNALQRLARVPLLVAADLEWGTGMRLIGGTAFPMAMAFGATGRELDAYQLGRVTALEARTVGIHLTFSPVADVNSNPKNPIINTRSFGEDPEAAARLLAAYIQGAHDHGLYTTAKHFPGHGDTETDSHIDLPVVAACWSGLDSLELVPFRAAVAAGVTAIMTAHVALPCVLGNDTPATLSPAVMSGVLRDSLGFTGLVVTDALTMGAIVRRFGPGESAVRAFLAGSDLLLIPADVRGAIDAMVTAVTAGRISMERLDQSVRRVLALKDHAGLFAERLVPLDSVPTVVGRRDLQALADDVAARALTLVRPGPLETIRARRSRTAVIVYAEETNLSAGDVLIGQLRQLGDTVTPFRIYPASGGLSYDSARTVIAGQPRVVFATSVRFIAGRGHVSMPDSLAQLILATAGRKPTIVASFGSPYLLDQLPGYPGAYLLAWSAAPATERGVARALSGGGAITGRLPITLGPELPRGFGIQVPANRRRSRR